MTTREAQVPAEPGKGSATRATLRIYLGAARGVGKTYAMLNEAHRRLERGADVVVALVETHGRPRTAAVLEDLEVVPRRAVDYRGAHFAELDVAAVIARRPEIALVDELAHTNVPGGRHDKRWQDVEDLLAAPPTSSAPCRAARPTRSPPTNSTSAHRRQTRVHRAHVHPDGRVLLIDIQTPGLTLGHHRARGGEVPGATAVAAWTTPASPTRRDTGIDQLGGGVPRQLAEMV